MLVPSASPASVSELPQLAAPSDRAAGQSFQTVLQSSALAHSVTKSAVKDVKVEARRDSEKKLERHLGESTGTYSTPTPLIASMNPAYALPGSGVAVFAQSGTIPGGDAAVAHPVQDQVAAVSASAPADSNSAHVIAPGQFATGSLPASIETSPAGPSSTIVPTEDQGMSASAPLPAAAAVVSGDSVSAPDGTNPALSASALATTTNLLRPLQLSTPRAPATSAQKGNATSTGAPLESSPLRHGHAAPGGRSPAALEKPSPTQDKALPGGTEQRLDAPALGMSKLTGKATTATLAVADPTQQVMTKQHATATAPENPPLPSHAEAASAVPGIASASLPVENGQAQSDSDADQAATANNLDFGMGTKTSKSAANGAGITLSSSLLSATPHAVSTPSSIGWEGSGPKPGVAQTQGHGGDSSSPATPSPAPYETGAAPELPGITTARLLQSLSRSEMQVKVSSEDFGRVTIHTAYGREAIAAQITLENTQLGSALGSALAAHMPAVEQKLGQDHGLRASVTIDTQPQAGGEQGRQRQSDAPPARRFSNAVSAVRDGTVSSMATAATKPLLSSSSTARLDIRI